MVKAKARAGSRNVGDTPVVLRVIADYLEKHGPERLVNLLKDDVLKGKELEVEDHASDLSVSLVEIDYEEIATKLRALRARSEGEDLLLSIFKNRRGLESLARHLQLPVQRDDSVKKLRSKIVENTIGSRLRSEAIQSGS